MPHLSEDEIDDLLYLSRTGESEEFTTFAEELRQRENTTLIQVLLAAKDPHSGNGPLHMAAANGHSEILAKLIAHLGGSAPQNPTQLAMLNTQNKAGNTALHWACLNGHLECVKVLLDSGADPTMTNTAGHDAVYEAELNDQTEVVEWVLKEGRGLEEGIGGVDAEGEGHDEGEAEEQIDDDGDIRGEETKAGGEGNRDMGEEKVRDGLRNLDMA